MPNHILTIENKDPSPGRDTPSKFNVKLVLPGDEYGRDDCLTNERDEPLVEFYDDKYRKDGKFGPLGQFISRYRMSTLIGDQWGPRNSALMLWGSEPSWTLDKEGVAKVLAWLEEWAP